MHPTRYALLLVATFAAIGLLVFAFTRKQDEARINLEFPRSAAQNSQFLVPLKISTAQTINAAEFYFSFPPDLVEVVKIDQSGSLFALWIKDQPTFNNKTGEVSFAGGLPNPGFNGKDGLIANVTFKAIKRGQGVISLDEIKSRILANDGLGTKVNALFEPISFTIN